MHSTHGVLKRVFGYAQHTRSDKREFFQYVSPHDLARCEILPISSLLATFDTIPVLKKLTFSIGKLLLSMGAHTVNSL